MEMIDMPYGKNMYSKVCNNLLFVFALFVCGESLIAQESSADSFKRAIRGVVTDVDSEAPIPFASVVVLNTSPQEGTITDSLGNFRIDDVRVGRYDIKVSCIGYKPAIIREILVTSAKEVYKEIKLKERLQDLDEIKVIANRNKERPLNPMALAGGRMISVEEANRYAGGFDDPARLVTSFAGVAGSPATNAIAIRGNSPQFLQWRLEGVEVPNPTHFSDMIGVGGGLFSGLSSQLLGNSDFFNGAFPAEYGNALSGVFDLSMRNGNNEHHEHTFQLGLLGLDFSSEGPLSRESGSSYIFNYRYSSAGLMGAFTENTGISYQDLAFKFHFPTRKAGTFSLWAIGLGDSNTTEALEEEEWETFADRQKSETTMKKGAGGITHRYFFNDKSYVKSSLASTCSNNHPLVHQMDPANENQYFPVVDMNSNNVDVVVSSYFNKKYSSLHTNRTGITVTKLLYDLDFSISPGFGLNEPMQKIAEGEGSATVWSAFSNSLFNLSEQLTATVGLHTQFFTLNNNWTLEPRLGLKWSPASKHAFALAYGLHSRRERLDYYYVEIPETGEKEVNKDLDLAMAHHFALAYTWHISQDVHLKIEPYYQHLYSVPVEPGSTFSIINHDEYYLDRQLVNTGKGKNYGVDLTLERYLKEGYYYMFTGSVFKSKYLGGDNVWRNTRLDRGYLFNLLSGKEWMWGSKKQNIFNANIRLSYHGGDRYTPIDEEESINSKEIIYDESQAYSQQFSPAFSTDIGISYKVNKAKVAHEFGLQVLNLTMGTGQHGYFYNEETNLIESQDVMSFLPNLSYKIHF